MLLVDDSPTEMRLMETALAGCGYRIFTAVDGEDALRKAARVRPDVVLLDVVLPKKSGFQVCRELKNRPETSHIRVLLVTSKSQATDRFWGMRQGADDYVTKPYTPEQLQERVARFLE